VEARIGLSVTLCRLLREAGELGRAVEVGERALDRELPGGWSDRLVELGSTLLSAYLERDELTRAGTLSSELLQAAGELGTPRAVAAASWNASTLATMTGSFERARRLGRQAGAALSLVGDRRATGRLRARLATNLLMARPEEFVRARALLMQAHADLVAGAAGQVDQAYCQLSLARTTLLAGQPHAALRQVAALLDRYPDAGNLVADAFTLQACAHRRLGEPAAAACALRRAGEMLERMPAPGRASRVWTASAEASAAAGDLTASAGAYRRALSAAGIC
jgi:tetratricopeptide (TPR) repeat protein